MIHNANAFVAKHHRYLLQFVQVGLQTLPLPGDNGRKEDGTSKRLRRTVQPAATEPSTASGATQTIFQVGTDCRRAGTGLYWQASDRHSSKPCREQLWQVA